MAPQELAELAEVVSRMRVMGLESPREVLVGATCLATPEILTARATGAASR